MVSGASSTPLFKGRVKGRRKSRRRSRRTTSLVLSGLLSTQVTPYRMFGQSILVCTFDSIKILSIFSGEVFLSCKRVNRDVHCCCCFCRSVLLGEPTVKGLTKVFSPDSSHRLHYFRHSPIRSLPSPVGSGVSIPFLTIVVSLRWFGRGIRSVVY